MRETDSIKTTDDKPHISILGDSISTFEGCNPPGYAVYYDRAKQRALSLHVPEFTWWGRVINSLGGILCANNSYSGSFVSGTDYRCGCSGERTSGLHSAYSRPDVILIYMGVNDFAFGAEPEEAGEDERLAFRPAYRLMLSRIRKNYPEAEIFCGTLMKPYTRCPSDRTFPGNSNGSAFRHFNEIIREVCAEQGCRLADLNSLWMKYETLDGVHPTLAGHRELAEGWRLAIGN